ncbi:conserved Plasmodium protein, unknown function [Plasmodium ovale]|uniref:RIIa domain-containing protein n=1 Tax=Plasmodium ovale TaxID=36330 RepID=A0A1D3THI7_PLAOA|nr:conserved Plasmodium protein, unknown function [Plasmodium ovale]
MEQKSDFAFKKLEKLNLDSYEVPPHFEEVLSEFTAKLIQAHPENVPLFAVNYFEEKLKKQT